MEYIIEFYERLFILNYLNVPERVRKLDRIHDPARSSHRDPLAPPSTPLFSLKDAAFTGRKRGGSRVFEQTLSLVVHESLHKNSRALQQQHLIEI